MDADDDGDGVPTSEEDDGNVDSDEFIDRLDVDDTDGPLGDIDFDGLNEEEAALDLDAVTDMDDDGVLDGVEVGGDVNNPADTDGDGRIDAEDPDDDGDTIATAIEGTEDVDRDGVPNYLDIDSDGVLPGDAVEGVGDDDGDGIPNFLDPTDNGPSTGLASRVERASTPTGAFGCAHTGGPNGGLAWLALAMAAAFTGADDRTLRATPPRYSLRQDPKGTPVSGPGGSAASM